jgi:hypothetical protein
VRGSPRFGIGRPGSGSSASSRGRARWCQRSRLDRGTPSSASPPSPYPYIAAAMVVIGLGDSCSTNPQRVSPEIVLPIPFRPYRGGFGRNELWPRGGTSGVHPSCTGPRGMRRVLPGRGPLFLEGERSRRAAAADDRRLREDAGAKVEVVGGGVLRGPAEVSGEPQPTSPAPPGRGSCAEPPGAPACPPRRRTPRGRTTCPRVLGGKLFASRAHEIDDPGVVEVEPVTSASSTRSSSARPPPTRTRVAGSRRFGGGVGPAVPTELSSSGVPATSLYHGLLYRAAYGTTPPRRKALAGGNSFRPNSSPI